MKDLYQEARQVELEAREKLIAKICQRKRKVSFASAIHAIAEREDKQVNISQTVDVAIDHYLESDLAAENLAEMWG
jgi:predicted DNA-binding ribbon-helix-helix protein